MCGICGMVGRPDRDALGRMASAMVHRGPDDDGFFVDEAAGLGFRRLSIIDVAGGHQPLTNEDGSLHLVFNGEIYNHRELRARLEASGHRPRTHSDGEVILHLYEEKGADLVDDLNGIFAFALWNPAAQELVLARDHHGVKPLYVASQGGGLTFASEIKALLASGRVPRDLDPEAVGQYLIYQAVPPPLSILRGVAQLPPGRVLVHRRGETRIRTYWTPPREVSRPVASVEEACEITLSGLKRAVKRQMMSERPLGVFLSGGVDSSALVALASDCVPHRLKTFSVGFVGRDEEVLTEWPWARMVAERYGTDHEEFVLSETMFRDGLPHALSAMDQPTSDAINSYWVSSAAARHVTVALSGTGADELLLGYGRDAHLLRHHQQGRPLGALPAAYVRAIARRLRPDVTSELWPSVAALAGAVRAYALLDEELISTSGFGIFKPYQRDAVLGWDTSDGAGAGSSLRPPTDFLTADVPPDLERPGDWLLRLEQRAYMSFVLLRDIDAMSMAHSLEVRVPFLDPEYGAELARVPWQMKLRDGVGKWVLKQALRPLLPDEVLFRQKMGFGLPYPVWMRRSLEPMIRDLLSPARIARRGVFAPAAVDRLVSRFYAGDEGIWRLVWTLFVFEGWASEVLDVGKEGRNAQAA
ncbi:MAG: asparagine synthase (glutamine-hydrolyzing) [Vicinamibacterales bacterium]